MLLGQSAGWWGHGFRFGVKENIILFDTLTAWIEKGLHRYPNWIEKLQVENIQQQ